MKEYSKLTNAEKVQVLKDEGLFLEKYNDGGNLIFVYYLRNFFVEITYKDNQFVDAIPYKRGYKLNKQDLHNLEKRNLLYNLAAWREKVISRFGS